VFIPPFSPPPGAAFLCVAGIKVDWGALIDPVQFAPRHLILSLVNLVCRLGNGTTAFHGSKRFGVFLART